MANVLPFEKVFLISLSFREDRREEFYKSYPESILGSATYWPAVHGDTVKHPDWWTAGNGAWGCYRSHMQILEHCYNNQIESYLVLEDDALFLPDFWEQFPAFMEALPEDWEQIYLGGQLLEEIANPPTKVNQEVYIPYDVNRTHCFGVHRRGYKVLYQHLNGDFHHGHHIDHHLGQLHRSKGVKCYVPNKWMVGQRESSSNISGKRTSTSFWSNPGDCAKDHWLFRQPMCVVLIAPFEVAKDLQTIGWHQGYHRSEEGVDHGVNQSLGSIYPDIGLRKWYEWIQRETVRDSKVIPCLWHPAITKEFAKKLHFCQDVIIIEADSVTEAYRQLESNDVYRVASKEISDVAA